MPSRLGQNFLRDKEVLDKIIKSANLTADDLVIEVGPGEGALSTELARRVGKLIMVEKDSHLAENTARNFQFSIFNFQSISNDLILNFKNKSSLIVGDILEINLPEMLKQNNFTNYKVVANIPYYITSPIIRLFLETAYPPKEMLLMVQKEVAERICAKAGKMSILALSVQYYTDAELLFAVPKTAFFPVPEVDSAVIRLTRIKKPSYAKAPTGEARNKEEIKKFFRIVKAGFSAKRKTLANNLSASLKLEKALVEEKLKSLRILPSQRAQELSLENWKKLSNLF
ncbi:MAG: 16S rRNA (adenine(1518)-N(6)/adenine(1519)-N(6))-dimethyltransferase RsmA [Parcubacteria group bacterium]|jgi:16S rRNA (adenine1518-N6/adenine1519-N6)-dimethyltransferase